LNPLFGRDGRVVGWLHSQGVIIDGNRRCRAYVQYCWVYDLEGRDLGQFQNGFLLDGAGRAVAFVRGASGGPPRPLTKLPPLPPVVQVPRVKPPLRAVEFKPTMCREWSPNSLEGFLSQVEQEPIALEIPEIA